MKQLIEYGYDAEGKPVYSFTDMDEYLDKVVYKNIDTLLANDIIRLLMYIDTYEGVDKVIPEDQNGLRASDFDNLMGALSFILTDTHLFDLLARHYQEAYDAVKEIIKVMSLVNIVDSVQQAYIEMYMDAYVCGTLARLKLKVTDSIETLRQLEFTEADLDIAEDSGLSPLVVMGLIGDQEQFKETLLDTYVEPGKLN